MKATVKIVCDSQEELGELLSKLKEVGGLKTAKFVYTTKKEEPKDILAAHGNEFLLVSRIAAKKSVFHKKNGVISSDGNAYVLFGRSENIEALCRIAKQELNIKVGKHETSWELSHGEYIWITNVFSLQQFHPEVAEALIKSEPYYKI